MSITIVDDGDTAWSIETDELVFALNRLGWAQYGTVWKEPVSPNPSEDPANVPYNRLCNETMAVEIGPDVWNNTYEKVFSYRPDLETGVWTLE